MISRRRFLKAGGAVALASLSGACRPSRIDSASTPGVVVNDIHSQLNATTVRRLITADSVTALREAVGAAAAEGVPVSLAGGRHAMGGQQFGTDMALIDTAKMNRVVAFDADNGLIEVEAGIRWPGLIDYLVQAQKGSAHAWGIVQKQTGADRLSIGGALSANAHGRGLTYKPIIQDVGVVGIPDFALFGPTLGKRAGDPGWLPDTDHNGDGVVGIPDFGIFTEIYGKPLGPSGLACAGSTPCTP